MTQNYDVTQGLPYIRVMATTIVYDEEGVATITAEQASCVQLPNGKIRKLATLLPVVYRVDLKTQGAETVDMVHPATGLLIGQSVSNNAIMLSILASIRAQQLVQNTDLVL